MMINRVLYNVLQYGINAVQQDTTLLSDLFGDLYGLTSTEVASIQTYFQTKTFTVVQGYPHQAMKPPVYALVLSAEQQDERFIGDEVGMVLDGSQYSNCDQYGAIWSHNYQVLCYADHPDVCFYMYEIAKNAFQGADHYMLEQNVLEWSYGGMDLMPDERYIPQNLFCRAMTITAKSQFTRIDRNSRLSKAFKVSGIAVAPSSPYGNGGVSTLVTTTIQVPTQSGE
jgi:hypothetical protein